MYTNEENQQRSYSYISCLEALCDIDHFETVKWWALHCSL